MFLYVLNYQVELNFLFFDSKFVLCLYVMVNSIALVHFELKMLRWLYVDIQRGNKIMNEDIWGKVIVAFVIDRDKRCIVTKEGLKLGYNWYG